MKKLDEIQIRYLTTDTRLAVEFENSNPELRSFIAVFAYKEKKPKPFSGFVGYDKFIKNIDMDNVLFALRKFDIYKRHMEPDYDPCPSNFINNVYLEDIKGVQNIEKELLKYLEDLSVLQPCWKCDIPV